MLLVLILGLHSANERRRYNAVSHWLGRNLQSALRLHYINPCTYIVHMLWTIKWCFIQSRNCMESFKENKIELIGPYICDEGLRHCCNKSHFPVYYTLFLSMKTDTLSTSLMMTWHNLCMHVLLHENFTSYSITHSLHDDVITWGCFPYNWPLFLKGICSSLVVSPHKISMIQQRFSVNWYSFPMVKNLINMFIWSENVVCPGLTTI